MRALPILLVFVAIFGNWGEIGADTIGGFFMLSFADENNGWAINWSGQLWKTETGGQNWNKFEGDSSQGAPPFAAAVNSFLSIPMRDGLEE